MNPRKKAKEIFNKFQDTIWESECTISKPMLKSVSILHVDEILQEFENVMTPNPFKQYWNEVKAELNNL